MVGFKDTDGATRLTIKFNQQVNSLSASVPFVGPETLERQSGQRFVSRIGANESAFGLSPLAVEALSKAINISGCSWYGDPENHDLRAALAIKHGVGIECICVDAGIDALLGLSVRMLMEPNDTVVTSDGAYPTFCYHVTGFGGLLNKVPYTNYHESPFELLSAAEANHASLIYIANPDNPMGTWHSSEMMQGMIDNIPKRSTLLLDEAYIEFAPNDTAPPIDTTNEKVIRYRTFSKAYGMAGMRIGYAIAHPDMISSFNKIRNHFAVNRLAQIAALASLEDRSFLSDVAHLVRQGRERIYTFAKERNLTYLPSATNFVALDLSNSERASELLVQLNQHGVFIRMPGVSPLNQFIRVGIGSQKEHDKFVQQFDKLYQPEPA